MEEKKLLKKKEKATGNNTALVSACTDLAQYYLTEAKFSKAIKEYQIVSDIYKTGHKIILYAQVNRGIGEAYMGLHQFEKALKYFKIHLNTSIQENDPLEQQRALAQLGHMFLTWYLELQSEENKKHLVKAYEYFMKSMKKCEFLPNNTEKQDMLARLFSNLGLVKECLGDYETSLSLFEKSLKICKTYELYEQLYRGHIAMASLFEKQENYLETIQQFNLAIEVAKKLSSNRVELVCAALLAKSDVLIKLADFSGAKFYLRKAYKFKTLNQEDRTIIERNLRVVAAICKLEDEIITTSDNKELKILYEKMGDGACDLKIFSKAIEYYKKMLEIAEGMGIGDKELGVCYYSLGETYKDNGQYAEAEQYFEKEYSLCKNSLKDSLNTLCKIADLKELAKNPANEIKIIYERALENCRTKGNLKEEKRIVIRYIDFLRRSLCYADAFKLEKRLNLINEKIGEDEGTSSSSEYESEDFETKVHVGDDIVLSDITDFSEDSDYEVPEPNTAQLVKRRKQNKVILKKNLNGEWPLHVASIKGDKKMVEYWLNVDHPVNVRDNAGWLPLHEAAIHGHLEIVRLLLDHKATINDRGGAECKGVTPLHDAASNGHLEVVKLLLDRGASALMKTDEGNTPLFELKRWYERTQPNFTPEQRALYSELKTRLTDALGRAGQSDVGTERANLFDMESPMKASTSREFPNIGRIRRNPVLFDREVEEDEDHLETENTEDYLQTSNQEERYASNEYQFVMQTLRHKNYSSPVKSQPNVKRSAYVDADGYVDENDWLEEDVRPTKSKRRKTDDSLKLSGSRTGSFGQENCSRKSPRKSARPDEESKLIIADDCDDDFIQTTPVTRRISNESNESSKSSKSKRKVQVTLLDSGFSKQRSSTSPRCKSGTKNRRSTDSLSQLKTLGLSQASSSSVEADSTTLPTELSQTILEPTLFVDVQIEGRLFRVPVLFSQIHNKTIKWLAGEAAHRYASKEYMKPTLELETANGAVLADDDLLSLLFPMSSTQADKVIAKVVEWSLPPLIDRYKETCNHMNLDIDTELCQIIEALSVNLDLLNRGVTGDHLCPLLKAINHQKTLTEINLSGNFLTTSCLAMLSNSIVTLPNLRVLNLSCTGLQVHHLGLLAGTITSHTAVFSNLKVLDLSDNLHLDSGCLRDLASITKVINLETLSLRGVKLRGVATFPDTLCLKTVKCLDVSDNDLELRDIRKMMSFTDGDVLKELNVSNNPAKGVLAAVFEVFDQQKSLALETVGLARCSVHDAELFELLRLAPNLSSLNLSYNSDLTSISLRRLLERTNLVYLNLVCCRNIWKYFDPNGDGWSVDIKTDSSETTIKISGGNHDGMRCITKLFKDKYPSLSVIRSYDFLSINLINA